MSIALRYYSIAVCDRCGKCVEEVDYRPEEEMEFLRRFGWTGTYRKCFCSACSKELEGKIDG